MKTPLKPHQLFCFWTALSCLLVASDQWIKMLVIEHFAYSQSLVITPFFNLVRAHNTGAAFSFLANAGGWQHWLFIGVAALVCALLLAMLWRSSTHKLSSFAMACILGGAIGNVIDRLRLGYVVDYLDFYWNRVHFPAFNLADIAICVGAGLLILNEVLLLMKKKKNTEST